MRHPPCSVIAAALAAALLPMPAAAAPRAGPARHQAAARGEISIPFESANKTIFIRALVGGRPFWFVLDTGDKYTIVDLAVARTLGLPMGDPVDVGGGGNAAITGNFIKGGTVVLPQVKGLALPIFLAIPLTELASASGHELAGVLGFDFISKFVVEIDYRAHRIVLRDPATYLYRGPGQSLPIRSMPPAIRWSRAGSSGRGRPKLSVDLVLDIGSSAPLILNRPFVAAQGLLAGRPTIKWLTGRAVGGEAAGRVGRLSGLQLGRFTITDPVVIFAQAEHGAFASNEEQGNIGSAILEKFRLILDYRRSRCILEPTPVLPKAIDYEKSGLIVTSTGGDFKTFVVDAVAEDLPAAAARIETGDVVVAIDGRPAAEHSLSDLREMLQQERPLRLTLARRGRRFEATIRPKRLI